MSTASENSRFVRRMIDSHSVLGLAFAALIYVVSLTGALVLFEHEIAVWENADAPGASQVTPEVLEQTVQNLLAASGGPTSDIVQPIVYAPSQFQPLLVARLNERLKPQSAFTSQDWIADPVTGDLLQPYRHNLLGIIEYLHTDLHLPRPWGRYLVGLLGVCMFTLILSGIFAHPTIIKDAFKLRLASNTRTAWTDVHNRLSVWGLPFHLVLTFTGAFLGIAGIATLAVAYIAYDGDTEAALEAIQGTQPIESRRTDGRIPIATMIETLDISTRTLELVIVDQPYNAGGVTSINLLEDKTLARRTGAQFRNSGEFTQYLGGKDGPGGLRALAMVQPLHYGTFGGYGIKAIYFVLSLALTYITSTGMMIWFRRRAQQGSPVPRTQALWHGMTTGLSLALALATLAAATKLPVSMPLIVFPTWIGVAALFWLLPGTQRLLTACYLTIGTLLTTSVIFHMPQAMGASAALKWHVIGIDCAIALIAAGHFWVVGSIMCRSKKAAFSV